MLICFFLFVNDFILFLIYLNKSCVLKREIIRDIEICLFLKLFIDNEDERGKNGENKKRANIFLYLVDIF